VNESTHPCLTLLLQTIVGREARLKVKVATKSDNIGHALVQHFVLSMKLLARW
jgi:predicted thioesterase